MLKQILNFFDVNRPWMSQDQRLVVEGHCSRYSGTFDVLIMEIGDQLLRFRPMFVEKRDF
jgi:hypothetical protein